MSDEFSSTQILIGLRITDSVSGRALPDAKIATSVRSGLGAYRPCPFELQRLRDGWFVIAPSHRVLVAKLRIGVTTRFRFDVSEKGYAPRAVDLLIPVGDFQEVDEDVEVGGVLVRRRRISGAPFEQRIALDPLPVRLAGQVLRDHDLNDPVAGASVSVTGGATATTMDDGRFLFDPLPLVASVDVVASLDTDISNATHIVDYRTPTNQLTLNFITDPND